ncbi:MAG: sigma 54-interacting transcriptional regulator [Ectothiorhodospiraceae bacterium]|jgi:transcriptional regulator with PAS, ATPase and Fis domain|nr:sigma 54-interacting transcriptional regulator [Ectothiorhodospiraceae bacterium]
MSAPDPFDSLLGSAPEFETQIRAARLVAASDASVLLLGESGTGKELLARALHALSPRANGPFVAINCAALPGELAESELFGHRRGAFTGADRDHPGYARLAAGGTLFLDEAGDLPLPLQSKLLRFLELGECQGVGELSPTRVDVRIIAATHQDLHRAVAEGRFRRDLFYRLHVVPLELPPLRQRGEDVLLLARRFLAEFAEHHGRPLAVFGRRAERALLRHDWPGNVRELRNLCERLSILLPGRVIEPENLPPELRGEAQAQSSFALPAGGIRLDDLEQDMIRQALDRSHGNKSRAARLLGISRDTLLYRLKKYAIEG